MQKPLRQDLIKHLLPSEKETEEWFHEVQKEGDVGAGVVVRCMVIACIHPDWPFWTVFEECKKTCERNEQLPEMLRRIPN